MPTEADLQADVAIVGGGLAGLALADRLHRAGLGLQLFEARPRLGGRIAALETAGGRVDLGPSWFWRGQPRIAALAAELGLGVFAQHAAGDGLFEDAGGGLQRGQGIATMAGAFRVAGGMAGLIGGLAARLPADRLHLQAPVRAVTAGGVRLADGRSCRARHVVLALPPRLAAGLDIAPALPEAARRSLAAIPTWMAAHAKLVAVYDRPFWRDAGLSGDAMSRRGPMAEIHDACGPGGTPAALFGFVGLPAARRADVAGLEAMAVAQLARLFGPAAARPLRVVVQDWAREPFTAAAADATPPPGHPPYGPTPALAGADARGLHLAVTEIAPDNGGLMEGALSAAERVAQAIIGARG